jgi:hypothetical protein
MSVPSGAARGEHQAPADRTTGRGRWGTICYALDSNARTLRLCLIMVAAGVPPSLIAMLIRRL